MRVLQINNYNYIKGGADRVYINTTELLKEYGHTTISFSSSNSKNINSDFSEYFVSLSDNREANVFKKISGFKNYLYNKKAYLNLEALIVDQKPDIAHLHLFYGGLTSSILKVLKKHKIPVVQTIHDYRLLCPANAFLDRRNNICEKCKNKYYVQCAFYRCLEGNIFYSSILTLEGYIRKYLVDPFKYIDHFIFVSKFAKQKHIEFDARFSEKSSHIYNFSFQTEIHRSEDAGSYFLFYGRLSKEKGLLTLIDAVRDTDLQLRIVGEGPLKSIVESVTEKHPNIRFLGYKTGNDLQEIINNSSYVIVPSEWYENNPMTIIEANFSGKPVIGSRIGGIPEIIIEGTSGFLFESRNRDDLRKLLIHAKSLNTDDYIKLCDGARQFAKSNFIAGFHYHQLLEVYKKVLKV